MRTYRVDSIGGDGLILLRVDSQKFQYDENSLVNSKLEIEDKTNKTYFSWA